MPPRHRYWTILIDGQPTAFRAAETEELLPTFNRLKEKHADTVMKWFERGRLWDSRDAARQEAPADSRERRDRGWRPGGEHRDPREKYQVAKKAKWQRFKDKIRERHETRGGPSSPPAARSGRPFSGPGPSKAGRPERERTRDLRPRPDRRPDRPRDERPKGDDRAEDKPRGDRPREERPWNQRPPDDRERRFEKPARPTGPAATPARPTGPRKPGGWGPPKPGAWSGQNRTGGPPKKWDKAPARPKPAGRDEWRRDAKPRPDDRKDRPWGDRPRGDRPQGNRPWSDRPRTDRPRGDRPWNDRPREDRPTGPKGPRPENRGPSSGKPRGDRPPSDRSRSDRRPPAGPGAKFRSGPPRGPSRGPRKPPKPRGGR